MLQIQEQVTDNNKGINSVKTRILYLFRPQIQNVCEIFPTPCIVKLSQHVFGYDFPFQTSTNTACMIKVQC
jgi:hypothetical protein